jgi:hypothetical protein
MGRTINESFYLKCVVAKSLEEVHIIFLSDKGENVMDRDPETWEANKSVLLY